MFGGFLGFLAVVALIVAAVRQHRRIEKLEANVDELRLKLLLSGAAAEEASAKRRLPRLPAAEADEADTAADEPVEASAPEAVVAGPWTNAAQVRGLKAAVVWRRRRRRSLRRKSARHRNRDRHALGGLGRRRRAGARRPLPGPLLDRGRHVRPRRAADPGRAPRPGAGRRPANSSAAPASRCRSKGARRRLCARRS